MVVVRERLTRRTGEKVMRAVTVAVTSCHLTLTSRRLVDGSEPQNIIKFDSPAKGYAPSEASRTTL